jgi:hypothetical protein
MRQAAPKCLTESGLFQVAWTRFTETGQLSCLEVAVAEPVALMLALSATGVPTGRRVGCRPVQA